jgi:hypothetical protein
MTDNQAIAQTLDYLRQSNHKEHVIAARMISDLLRELARLRAEKGSLLRSAVVVDASKATPEQIMRGAAIMRSLKEPKT